MNRLLGCSIIALLCLVQNLYANHSDKSFGVNRYFSDIEVEAQLASISKNADWTYNRDVKKLINELLTKGKKTCSILKDRSEFYFPIIERVLAESDVPQELKYLAVIESGLRPKVRSKVGAVGLWQFMSSTAKMYDLKIKKHIDQRRDVHAASYAAAEFLKDLHKQFGNWELAIAAYNCGPGNVKKAIRKSGGKRSYWEIRRYLPRETRRYVPKFVAMMYIFHFFDSFDFNEVDADYTEHKSFGVAKLYNKFTFNELSNLSGLSKSQIKKFNPAFVYSYVPQNSKEGHWLILPEVHMKTFLQNTSNVELLNHVFYTQNELHPIRDIVVEMPIVEVKEEIKPQVVREIYDECTLNVHKVKPLLMNDEILISFRGRRYPVKIPNYTGQQRQWATHAEIF